MVDALNSTPHQLHPALNPWLFPKSLHGNHAVSHRWWRKTVKEVWKAKSWSAVLDGKQFVDVRETPGDILFEVTSHGVMDPHRDSPHWFLSWVGDDRPYDIDVATTEMLLAEQALLKQGLGFLWYTIGHLGQRHFLPKGIWTRHNDKNGKALHQAIADAVIYWLPEIAMLSPRLTTNGFAAGQPEGNKFFGPRMPSWMTAFLVTLGSARYRLPAVGDLWEGLYPQHQGNVLDFMLEIGVIESTGDRFRVSSIVRRF